MHVQDPPLFEQFVEISSVLKMKVYQRFDSCSIHILILAFLVFSLLIPTCARYSMCVIFCTGCVGVCVCFSSQCISECLYRCFFFFFLEVRVCFFFFFSFWLLLFFRSIYIHIYEQWSGEIIRNKKKAKENIKMPLESTGCSSHRQILPETWSALISVSMHCHQSTHHGMVWADRLWIWRRTELIISWQLIDEIKRDTMFILSCQQLATCNQVLPIDDDETKVFTMTSKRINMCNKTKNICVNSKTSNDLPFFTGG